MDIKYIMKMQQVVLSTGKDAITERSVSLKTAKSKNVFFMSGDEE